MDKLAGKSQLFHIFYGLLGVSLLGVWYCCLYFLFQSAVDLGVIAIVITTLFILASSMFVGYRLSIAVWQAYEFKKEHKL